MPVDYRYLYEIIVDRAEREEDFGKAIDAKIIALLAGVVAFIGFSFRLQFKGWSTGSALLYLVPLGFLLSAFMTKLGPLAPSVEAVETFFPQYPVSTLKKAAGAVASACRTNQSINDRKASRLEMATLLTASRDGCRSHRALRRKLTLTQETRASPFPAFAVLRSLGDDRSC